MLQDPWFTKQLTVVNSDIQRERERERERERADLCII